MSIIGGTARGLTVQNYVYDPDPEVLAWVAMTQPLVNTDTLTVSGTISNFPETQPISAASLPLPAGAATETSIVNIRDYYSKMFAYNVDNLEYVGFAAAGTAVDAVGWAIKKFTYDGANLTQVGWADGVITFTKIWNNKGDYVYS